MMSSRNNSSSSVVPRTGKAKAARIRADSANERERHKTIKEEQQVKRTVRRGGYRLISLKERFRAADGRLEELKAGSMV
jgi:hypothetical protein